jgi:multiple sugar transport system permease protein
MTRTQDVDTRQPKWQHWFGRDILSGITLGGPAFLGILLFLIIPFLAGVLFSFTDQRLLSPNPTKFVGLRNYDRLLNLTVLTLQPDDSGAFPRSRSITRTEPRFEGFREWFSIDAFGNRYVILAKDPLFYRSVLNTFLFVALVLPLQLTIALIMALLVNQKLPGVMIFRAIYFSPVITSMVVISIIWIFLYDDDVGLINQMLKSLTFGLLGPFDWLGSAQYAMVAIVIMSAWQGMGFQMVIFLAGLKGIPDFLYEAASIDGADKWQQFRFVTLPGLKNTFVFIIITTTILAFRLFTQVNIMTQGGPRDSTTTIMYHLVRKGFNEQNIAYGATISVVFFIMILMIALIQRRVLRGFAE